ncbi:hypothetical protein CspeluHIS016_0903300 [Cutaneotrichosporon spelunceum]|uniref:Thioredoxin domain-containing protein n=1 Tax=Cutaneotrichosporon spelunceum TaxID=1672016 RepID=A0AAD3YFE7_9TREE|nr:hypothetical protein CspeluHIS016_0903300 [Cutaneotrichosporon spelunceum]
MHIPTLAAALLVAPLMATAGMYSKPVVNIDAKDFKKAMSKEHAAMVAFVAPWCGHCKNMAPEYSSAASSLEPLIPFYAVDCDASQNKALCAEYGIQGFPTIKAFPKAGKGAARDYNGERKKAALVEYAKSMVPDRVKKLRLDGNAHKVVTGFLADSSLPHALLVHPSQPSIPFLWKVLGQRLTGKAYLGYVKDVKGDIASDLGLESSKGSRLLFWEAGSDKASEYAGPLKFNALLEWLEAAIEGDIRKVEKRSEEPSSTSTKAKDQASGKAVKTEDASARRARLQAKMDEIDRRDRLRREREAAKKAAEDEATGGTPVEEAPAAEPEEETATPGVTHTHPAVHTEPVAREAEPELEPTEATPADAPPAEPADVGDEPETQASDWDAWPESSSDIAEHSRDEL